MRTPFPEVAIVILSLAVHFQAVAQGSDNLLPEAIDAGRIELLATQIGASSAQRSFMYSSHDQYMENVHQFWKTEVSEWLRERGVGVPNRNWFLRQRDLRNRIGSMDDELMVCMRSILTAEQNEKLSIEARTRSRQRTIQILWQVEPKVIDLSETVRQIDVPHINSTSLEQLLVTYESELETLLARCLNVVQTGEIRQFEAYDRAGIHADEVNHPSNANLVLELYKEVYNDQAKLQFQAATTVLSLNKRTLTAMRGLIDPAAYSQVRQSLISAVYPQLSRLFPLVDTYKVWPAPTTPSRLHTTLDHGGTEHLRVADEVMDVLMQMIDRSRAAYLPLGTNVDAARASADRRAIENAIDLAATTLRGDTKTPEHSSGVAHKDISGSAVPIFAAADRWIVGSLGRTPFIVVEPISRREVLGMSQRLAFDESRIQQMFAVYDRYADACQQIVAARRKLYDYGIALLNDDDLARHHIEEYCSLQRKYVLSMQAADSAFFSDVNGTLVTDAEHLELSRINSERRRSSLNHGLVGGMRNGVATAGGCSAWFIDLSLLVRDAPWFDPADQRLMDQLDSYTERLDQHFAARFDLILATIEAELCQVMLRSRTHGAVTRATMLQWNKEFGVDAIREKCNQVNHAILLLNHRTVSALSEALPAEYAHELQRRYERIAWPRIYTAMARSSDAINAALQLDGLSSSQRLNLQDVAASFHSAYDHVCARMTIACEPFDSPAYRWLSPTFEEAALLRERSSHRRLLLSERNSLETRVWHRLRSALNEGQIAAIGLPATPPPPPDPNDDFGD